MNKLSQTSDPTSIAKCDKAFDNFEQGYLNFAIELWRVKESQGYLRAGYDTFESFVFSRYQRRLRAAQYFANIGGMAVENNITRTDVSLSNMRTIAPHINQDNKKELLEAAKELTYEKLREYIKKKLPYKSVVGRIAINFYDKGDYLIARLGMEIARRVNQSSSKQKAMVSMAEEFYSTHVEIASEISEDYGTVSLEVYARDGWKCQCGREECPALYGPLHRHSICGHHKTAKVDECTTLSADCHELVTNNKAKVTLLAPGKIKYEVLPL